MIKKWFKKRLASDQPETDPIDLLREAQAKELDVAQAVDDMRTLRKRNNFGPNFRVAMKEAPRWR